MGQFKIPIYVINFGLDLQKMVPYKMDICQIIQVEFGAGRRSRFGAISCNINKYFSTFLNRSFSVIILVKPVVSCKSKEFNLFFPDLIS